MLVFVLLAISTGVSYQSGIASKKLPAGYAAYNIDPTLSNITLNGLVYDPNFIPGFKVGLPNTSISFETGLGYGNIGYWIGPWNETYYQVPHLAVGPQNSNFQEIPRTQQFRMPSWGDYNAVKAAFVSPGVNIPNYNASFLLTQPIYVGLRTDWNWDVQMSMDWNIPTLLDQKNEWVAIGLATTEYVPNAPTKLIYTVVDFWMDKNSSIFGAVTSNQGSAGNYSIVRIGTDTVTYHPMQLSTSGNVTVNINLTRYTEETLRLLGYASSSQPPVLSYTFLDVEGYNFRWNGTLYSFYDMSDSNNSNQATNYMILVPLVAVVTIVAVAGSFYVLKRNKQSRRRGAL